MKDSTRQLNLQLWLLHSPRAIQRGTLTVVGTDHITSDVNNLTLLSDYRGPDQVSVSNGASLRISHVGSSFVSTPSGQFRLSNMLHVPNIAVNLLSVHRFATNNNCVFYFDASVFCVKDKAARRMFFQGQSENDLYPFPLSLQSSQSNKTRPSAFIGEKVNAPVWHSRLKHPASAILRHLLSEFKLPLHGSSKFDSFFSNCQLGKSKKVPFLNSTSLSSQPLELLVHCDLWGSSPKQSISGYH